MEYINDTPWLAYTLISALCLLVLLAVGYYFFRWVFSIEKQLSNQEKQLRLLGKIAEKNGLSDHEVREIIDPIT